MIELTDEQHEALAADPQTPPVVIDPKTNETYRLVRAAVYARVEHALQDDDAPSKRDVAMLVAQAMKEYDAHDPTLELYQHD